MSPTQAGSPADGSLREVSEIFEETKSNLIVVSNRLPFVLKKDQDGNLFRKSSAGGLVTAVAPVVVESGGMKLY